MSFAHVHPRSRRVLAAAAAILIAGIGLTAATGGAAQAATAAGSDARVTVTWDSVELATDLTGNGRLDPGDFVKVTATFTAVDRAVFLTSVTGTDFLWIPGTLIGAGESVPLSTTFLVTPSHLEGAGNTGPLLTNLQLNYVHRLRSYNLPLTPPPVLYTAPDPLTVSTDLDVVENGGTVPGAVLEGDTVGFHTTLTNTTPRTMTITAMPGYDDFPGSATLAPGESATFTHSPRAVTYDDMVAGSVTFPAATIEWSAAYNLPSAKVFTGSATATPASVPTEAIVATSAVAASFVVHSAATGDKVPLGDAQVGDVIDMTFDATNTGNVTLQYGQISQGAWGAGTTSVTHTDSALTPGAALPTGTWKPRELKSAGNGVFSPYVLTAADVARGYVDLDASLAFAPTEAAYLANPAAYTQTVGERVFLRRFTMNANLAVTAELADANGDGLGQAGETVDFRVRLKNNANQDIQIGTVTDLAGSHVAGEANPKFTGKVLAPTEVIAKAWTYTITPADETRGTIDYGALIDYEGIVTGASNSRSEWAPTVPTGAYVAPATTLDVSASYVDTSADGKPSIGEVVTVSVVVANVGTYPLTGLVVVDDAGADVTGLLPSFSGTVAAGATETQTFTYTLTAADFARGSLAYSAAMSADGMTLTGARTSVLLSPITFAAAATDLDAMQTGGIAVCTLAGTPTSEITNGQAFKVMPEGCDFTAPPTGYRIVIFSDPVVLAVGSFEARTPPLTAVGAHRIALYAADGSLVGWRAVTVKDPIVLSGDDGLALTGANAARTSGLLAGAAALTLLGAGALVWSRRREA